MAKIKLTKNELKQQKDALERYQRYLPTLQLKKQQLQLEILRIQRELDGVQQEIKDFEKEFVKWVDVFAEDIDVKSLFPEAKVITRAGNVAGVDIPVLENVDFQRKEYDLLSVPLWVDFGVLAVEKMVSLRVKQQILAKQLEAVREELRITTQRVNLFEKVKIPEAQENIRKIRIYIGDLQTAAVVIGKIAKDKIQKRVDLVSA